MLTSYYNSRLNDSINPNVYLFLRVQQNNCHSKIGIIDFFNSEHYQIEVNYLKQVIKNLNFIDTDYTIISTAQTPQLHLSDLNTEQQTFIKKINYYDNLSDVSNLITKNLIILIDATFWKSQLSKMLETNLFTKLYIIRHEGDFNFTKSLSIKCDCNHCLLNSINESNLDLNFTELDQAMWYHNGCHYSMLIYNKSKLFDINDNIDNKFCKINLSKSNTNSIKLIDDYYNKINFKLPLRVDPYINYSRLGSPKYIAAPMVGQSELAFRMMVRDLGVQLCYTPMINAKLFLQSKEYQQELFDLENSNYLDRPLAVQFAANNSEELVAAARLVKNHCDMIDINLGCPQPVARRHGYGAWLMENPELIYELIQALIREIDLPVSCKIRIFPEVTATIKYAQMLVAAGCSLLTIHGRTRNSRMNLEPADWEHIKQVRSELNIPVIANGSIISLEQANACLAVTNCDGVMAASHLLANPYLFMENQPKPQQQAIMYLKYADRYQARLNYAIPHVLQIIKPYLTSQQQDQIQQADSIIKLTKIVTELSIDHLKLDPELKQQEQVNAIELVSLGKPLITNELNSITYKLT